MKPERYQRICEVFVAARSKSHAERASYLDAACGDDALLREEVESLLANDDAATNFLDNPVLGDDFLVQGPPTRAIRASDGTSSSDGVQAHSDRRHSENRSTPQRKPNTTDAFGSVIGSDDAPTTIKRMPDRRAIRLATVCVATIVMAAISIWYASRSSDERDAARLAATLIEQERADAVQETATIAIDAADVAIRANDVAAARRYLDAVPESLRDSTWQALLRRTDESIITLSEHDGAVLSLAFSPDWSMLASAATDGTLRFWNAESHKLQKTILMPATAFSSIAFAPSGTILIAGSLGGELSVWDIEQKEPLAIRKAHESRITCVAVNADGMTFASAGEDATVRLWDAAAYDETMRIDHPAAVASVAFDRSGKRMATGCADGIVRVWRLDDEQAVELLQLQAEYCEPQASQGPVVAFSPDGKMLAAGSAVGLVTVWNLDNGDRVLTLAGHRSEIRCVAFSPDESRLAGGSSNATLRLWDTSSGAMIATLRGHTDSVTSVVFGPRGDLLATASLDTTIRLWDSMSRSDAPKARQTDTP